MKIAYSTTRVRWSSSQFVVYIHKDLTTNSTNSKRTLGFIILSYIYLSISSGKVGLNQSTSSKINFNDIICINTYYIIIAKNNVCRWRLPNLDDIFQRLYDAIDQGCIEKLYLLTLFISWFEGISHKGSPFYLHF